MERDGWLARKTSETEVRKGKKEAGPDEEKCYGRVELRQPAATVASSAPQEPSETGNTFKDFARRGSLFSFSLLAGFAAGLAGRADSTGQPDKRVPAARHVDRGASCSNAYRGVTREYPPKICSFLAIFIAGGSMFPRNRLGSDFVECSCRKECMNRRERRSRGGERGEMYE
ncbi:hypothetical protein MRX96_051107 [Rhipicephalus microplus]